MGGGSAWLPAGCSWHRLGRQPVHAVAPRVLADARSQHRTLEALFGVYALGLIPGLLLAGPLSDARGRRAVVLPAAGLSLAASVTLAAGAAMSRCSTPAA